MKLDGEVWTARAYDEDEVIEAGDARAGHRDQGRDGARERVEESAWPRLIVAVVLALFVFFVAAPDGPDRAAGARRRRRAARALLPHAGRRG